MKREVKIGIFAVVMIGCLWAGIRFLSGIDIFSRNVTYYASYDRVDGVQSASPVMLRGVKVGTVTDITFDEETGERVMLELTVKRQVTIPRDSEAKIFTNGLMGGKAIALQLGSSPELLQKGDTIRSASERDLMEMAGSEIDFLNEKIGAVADNLTVTLASLNAILEQNGDNLHATLTHLNRLTGDLSQVLGEQKASLNEAVAGVAELGRVMGENAERVDRIVGNADRFVAELTAGEMAAELNASITQLHSLLEQINAGEGSIGRLVQDEALYNSLQEAGENLASLLKDLEEHPKRYVHFSLFGNGSRKEQRAYEKQQAAEQENLPAGE